MIMKGENTIILMHSSIQDKHAIQIENGILQRIQENQFHRYNNICSFLAHLAKQPSYRVIALIVIRDYRELKEILNEKETLIDRQLILICPHPSIISTNNHDSTDMIQECFKLYPRYASYMKEDFTDVFTVLERMINRIENQI